MQGTMNKVTGNQITGILQTLEYGVLSYIYNPVLKIASLIWSGNSTTPSESGVMVDLPSYLRPAYGTPKVAIRNGDLMEVRRDGKVQLIFGTSPKAWSGTTATYFLE